MSDTPPKHPIKRLVDRGLSLIKGDKASSPRLKAVALGPDQHPVRASMISPNAVKALKRLEEAGYEAYLVGGGVRDILAGLTPKDFDIATNAHPEEIKQLFSNCRLIGRRFRLAHLLFGREIIEVATFRAQATQHSEHSKADKDTGRILRDNIYGTIEEDAARRDFTINALYYRVSDDVVLDFAGGCRDLETKTLRLIGDPEARYREDPVRMLRAVRFMAKLGVTLDNVTEAPIRELAYLLEDIPAARLFDEVQKLFLSGQARRTLELLIEYDLLRPLFPATVASFKHNSAYKAMLLKAMDNTDARININKPVTPAFLFAVFLWGPVQENWSRAKNKNIPPIPALQKAMHETISAQCLMTSIPKRFSLPLREIWELQLRLPRRNGRAADALLERQRFRAAYDFLLLREESGETEPGLGEWWTRYQEADEDERVAMASAAPKPKRRKKRKK